MQSALFRYYNHHKSKKLQSFSNEYNKNKQTSFSPSKTPSISPSIPFTVNVPYEASIIFDASVSSFTTLQMGINTLQVILNGPMTYTFNLDSQIDGIFGIYTVTITCESPVPTQSPITPTPTHPLQTFTCDSNTNGQFNGFPPYSADLT